MMEKNENVRKARKGDEADVLEIANADCHVLKKLRHVRSSGFRLYSSFCLKNHRY